MRVKLIDLCTPKQWKTLQTSELLEEGYPVYGANGIIGYYSEYNHEKSVIAITCRGATCGTINITVPESYVTGNAMCLDNVRSDVLQKYLYYCLQHYDFNNVINGSAQPQITRQGLEKVEIELCSLEEQRRIITILDNVSAEIAGRKRQNQKLEELIKSRFVEMFGDPVTNSKGYPIHQLSDHILFLTSGSRGWAQYYTDKGEWFITIKNVKDCRISVDDVQCINPPKNAEAERTRLREGDLLISITADLGRTGVVTKEIAEHGAYNNQHLTCIRLDRLALDPLYAAFFMESEAGKRQFEAKNMSAVKAGLNFDSIRSLRLIVPPLALQKEFTAFVSEVDKSKLAVKQSLEKLETLKKSLMQQYFG